MGVNKYNQIEHLSVQTFFIILTSLKFCSNLACLFTKLSLNKFFLSNLNVIEHKTLFKFGFANWEMKFEQALTKLSSIRVSNSLVHFSMFKC